MEVDAGIPRHSRTRRGSVALRPITSLETKQGEQGEEGEALGVPVGQIDVYAQYRPSFRGRPIHPRCILHASTTDSTPVAPSPTAERPLCHRYTRPAWVFRRHSTLIYTRSSPTPGSTSQPASPSALPDASLASARTNNHTRLPIPSHSLPSPHPLLTKQPKPPPPPHPPQ